MLCERPDRGITSGSLEPDLSRCFVCGCGRCGLMRSFCQAKNVNGFGALRAISASQNGSLVTPDPSDQKEKNILRVPENFTVGFSDLGLYSRVISVTSRYFGQDSEYNVGALTGAARL